MGRLLFASKESAHSSKHTEQPAEATRCLVPEATRCLVPAPTGTKASPAEDGASGMEAEIPQRHLAKSNMQSPDFQTAEILNRLRPRRSSCRKETEKNPTLI